MADDPEIPPLEDMTDFLKHASVLRDSHLKETSVDTPPPAGKNSQCAKDRAKVKKNVMAKAVPVADQGTETRQDEQNMAKNSTSSNSKTEVPATLSSSSPSTASTKALSTGLFGGMKKGFLFGGPSKSSSVSASKVTKSAATEKRKSKTDQTQGKTLTEDIPYICPSTGTTQSGLTLTEVQQAMSEAKGLLDSQDWINDDLLTKVENNDLLVKRFSDHHFMQALEEFQKNPTAALEKYKGNHEIEKFLSEFCGLLGDHFTTMGDSSGVTDPPQNLTQPLKNRQPPELVKSDGKQKPKIVELDENSETSEAHIVDSHTSVPRTTDIVGDSLLKQSPKPDNVFKTQLHDRPKSQIKLHRQEQQADIQELPAPDDAAVKKMLDDPKVMEHLLDSRVMTLIKTLKSDPGEAQRMVDLADADFREKIGFLVSRGLLRFEEK